MPIPSLLDVWLAEWDELSARGQAPPIDTFIQQRCSGAPPSLVKEFRAQANALCSMNRRLGRALEHQSSTRPPDGNTEGGSSSGSPWHQGYEPVPGYQLKCKLGRGGYGEVWQAVAPGGMPVALKLVQLDRRSAQAEVRSLEILRRVRHPHLLAVVGAWQTDEGLILAMELADRTLRNRYQQAVREGHVGIPQDELLRYLAEAAEGLDYLHQPSHVTPDGKQGPIEHRDIKPDNLLLLGNSIKVGDFGLSRYLEHSLTGHSGPMTIAYAAPEFFEGKTSIHSDQYSLAVSYCELRGGRLPFTGSRAQVMAGHLHRPPDLSMLPAEERLVVARSLAKKPDTRWPSCSAFVEALQNTALAKAAEPSRPGTKKWMRTLIGAAAAFIATLILLALSLFSGGSPNAKQTTTAVVHGDTRPEPFVRDPSSGPITAKGPDTTKPKDVAKQSNPTVVLQTALGKVRIELYPEKAPRAVNMFLTLVDAEHYDGTLLLGDAVVFGLGGGSLEVVKSTPTVTQTKKLPPFKPEAPTENESLEKTGLPKTRGAVAVLWGKFPNPEFMVSIKDSGYGRLDSRCCVFGKIVEGMDVIDKVVAQGKRVLIESVRQEK